MTQSENLLCELTQRAEAIPLGRQTALQRLTIAFADLDAQVQNGGFRQYLDNIIKGDLTVVAGMLWLLNGHHELELLYSILHNLHNISTREDTCGEDHVTTAWLQKLDGYYSEWRQGGLPSLCRFLGTDPDRYAQELAQQAEIAAQAARVF